MNTPFYFYTQFNLTILLGLKAKNITELLKGLKKIPAPSVYYHTHRFLQQHHYLSPEPPNDFAYWTANILSLEELGELLASVDTVSFNNIEDLRTTFIKILTNYMSAEKCNFNCPEGQEFDFMSCVTFVMPTPYVANNLKEFVKILDKITIRSLYFHVFEARIRLKKDENDFTAWFKAIGEFELAKKLSTLDPYTITLEGLRKKIITAVSKYAGN
ncbi:MAG: DUF5752 family protein [bacterium]|nr:DUF5752 family protein [bacterium]